MYHALCIALVRMKELPGLIGMVGRIFDPKLPFYHGNPLVSRCSNPYCRCQLRSYFTYFSCRSATRRKFGATISYPSLLRPSFAQPFLLSLTLLALLHFPFVRQESNSAIPFVMGFHSCALS